MGRKDFESNVAPLARKAHTRTEICSDGGPLEQPGTSPSPLAQNHTPHATDAEDARRAAVSAHQQDKPYEDRGRGGRAVTQEGVGRVARL